MLEIKSFFLVFLSLLSLLKMQSLKYFYFFKIFLNLAWYNETSEPAFLPSFYPLPHSKISIHWEHGGLRFLIFRITWILHFYCNLWITFPDQKERKKPQESIQNREHTDVTALWGFSMPCLKLPSTRQNKTGQHNFGSQFQEEAKTLETVNKDIHDTWMQLNHQRLI